MFLAGDAAHIVPPTGAKGLNLAVADVRVLSRALIEFFRTGSTDRVDRYSDTCLKRVWKVTRYSNYMTSFLHRFDQHAPFDQRMQQAELEYVAGSVAARTTIERELRGAAVRGGLTHAGGAPHPCLQPRRGQPMPYATAKDDVKLYYEEAGSGTPIIFSPRVRRRLPQLGAPDTVFFAAAPLHHILGARLQALRRPEDWKAYSYMHWVNDAVAILDHLKIDKAHFVGLSMGGYTALMIGLHQPGRRCR